jgi:hypothetical protein
VDFLNHNATGGPGPAGVWTYPKGPVADATIQVSVVLTMAEFAAALDEPDAYVIYEGHSRYGQGPVFSADFIPVCPPADKFPVNPWGDHFRMGYDAVNSEAADDLLLLSVNPAEFNLLAASTTDFLPTELAEAAKRAQSRAETKSPCSIQHAWREFETCEAKLAKTETCRKETPLKGRHFHFTRGPKTKTEHLTPVVVGSKDLDKASLKCKLLFMISCSSYAHYFAPLDRRRKAATSKCKFYLTGDLCWADSGRMFLQQIFKGLDPVSAAGAKKVLSALNGQDGAGRIDMY